MIRKVLARLLGGCAKRMEGFMSPEEIKAMILKGVSELRIPDNADAKLQKEMNDLKTLLRQLDWLKEDQIDLAEAGTLPKPNESWRALLVQGRIFDKQGWQAGSADKLLCLLEESDPSIQQAFHQTMEALLRHVEVKRQKSLRKFQLPLTRPQQRLERHAISILFSRYARQKSDLRFLNAALKMNEWFAQHDRKFAYALERVRRLRALAEQELSARELLA
jgi:hypothetical protein